LPETFTGAPAAAASIAAATSCRLISAVVIIGEFKSTPCIVFWAGTGTADANRNATAKDRYSRRGMALSLPAKGEDTPKSRLMDRNFSW
jgi:hypothetical protein